MKLILENPQASVTIESLGAELTHFTLKENNTDYIWHGDPTYWTGHSPVLFPIIGSLNHGEILIHNKKYAMGNHGFARRSEFEVVHSTETTAHLRLTESETSLAMYPFPFSLELIYTLSNTSLQIDYRVTNTGDTPLPFSLGTHPAFICPIGSSESLSEWTLTFNQEETLERIGLQGNLINLNDRTLFMDHTDTLPLKASDFYDGAIVFKNVISRSVLLSSPVTNESVKVQWENLPDLAIWQPKDAPFFCIEPWHGHGDPIGFDQDIFSKPGIIQLSPEEIYTAQLTLSIH